MNGGRLSHVSDFGRDGTVSYSYHVHSFCQRHMFVQDDKQSDPAALEHQQVNRDEVRVNIRHVLIAEMMNVAKARTRVRTRAGSVAETRHWLPAQLGSSSNSVSNVLGRLRFRTGSNQFDLTSCFLRSH